MAKPETSNSTTGLLLAGGRSTRMGGVEKALLDLGGRPMLARVVERMRPQVSRLVLNANGDPARFASFGLPVVPDTVEGYAGPLAGVLAGLRWSAAHAPLARYMASVSADAPFIPAVLVARLLGALPGDRETIVMAASRNRPHPVVALWPLAAADEIARALSRGEHRVMAFAERRGSIAVAFEDVEIAGHAIDPFFNVNTPAELAEARTLLGG